MFKLYKIIFEFLTELLNKIEINFSEVEKINGLF